MAKALEFKDIGDGLKTLNFEPFGGLEGFLTATSNVTASGRPQQLRRISAWMAKATDMTALAVSELPFDIMKGDEVFDTSADWKNRIGGMPTPQVLLYNLAASLCLGAAYVIPTLTSRAIAYLQYCAPQSVTPWIPDDVEWFDRTTSYGQQTRYYPAGEKQEPEMLYFWLPDSDVEIGPAQSTPAGTAQLSCELLTAMDSTIHVNASRGFVPPTILAAKGMSNPAEREKAENWWNRFLQRFTTTTAKIINSDSMSVLKVGAGMDELRTIYAELYRQAIENIGAAYGIPAAVFMSDMAFASEVNPLIKVWYTSGPFTKIYRCIEQTFNTQLLNRYGLRMAFRPETIDAFQEDEAQRAGAFKTYVDAGIKLSVAAQMVGLELPQGVEYDDLDPEEKPVPPQLAPFAGQNNLPAQPEPEPQPDAAVDKAFGQWERKAINRLRDTGSAACDFVSDAIDAEDNDRITGALAGCKTNADIRAVFSTRPVDQLKRALDWLETHERIGA